mgnify:CR=1 FL=1
MTPEGAMWRVIEELMDRWDRNNFGVGGGRGRPGLREGLGEDEARPPRAEADYCDEGGEG